jgi:hypothetical protein
MDDAQDHEFIWMPQGKKVPERELHTIQSNPRGFHLIGVLAKGRKFNATNYIPKILSVPSKSRSTKAKGDRPTVIVHADNARPHTALLSPQFFEQNRMRNPPHPPHSPHLVPSDFDRFGYLKRCLAGFLFENADELLERVWGVLSDIEKVSLQVVFLEWMEQLRKYIATNGEDVESSKIDVRERLTFIRTLVTCSHLRETPSTSRPALGR